MALGHIMTNVAVSCGYSTCFAVGTCDGLCRPTFPIDHMDLCQTHCKQVPDFSRSQGHMVRFANKIGSLQFLPRVLHELCFGCCFSGPLPLCSLINDPHIGVRFLESLVIRLHSEIDQIHLSIEAQCGITLLPLGDCHTPYEFIFVKTGCTKNLQGLCALFISITCN